MILILESVLELPVFSTLNSSVALLPVCVLTHILPSLFMRNLSVPPVSNAITSAAGNLIFVLLSPICSIISFICNLPVTTLRFPEASILTLFTALPCLNTWNVL